jgi:ribosomal protein S18 acetylase RimI-like enzyme
VADRFFNALEAEAGEKQVFYVGPFTVVGDQRGGILGKLEVSIFSRQSDGAPSVHLAYIGVNRDERQQGRGTRLMQIMLAAADAAGLPVDLEVDPQTERGDAKPPMNKKQLREFYKRFGFHTVRGMGSDYMERPVPQRANPRRRNPSMRDLGFEKAHEWDMQHRHDRSEAWFEGGEADLFALQGFEEAERAGGSRLLAHGMSKAGTLSVAVTSLMQMLAGGLDLQRGGGALFVAPLTSGLRGSGGGTGTASGTSYRDGPFILVARPGEDLAGNLSGLGAILVNEAHPEIVPEIRDLVRDLFRPDIIVDSYSNAGKVVKALMNKPARGAGWRTSYRG